MMCCYYPTTTIAIDDDIDFLNIVTQHLGITDCIANNSPNKVIESLTNQTPFERIQSRIIKATQSFEEFDFLPEDQLISITIRKLHEEIYNKNRFQDVSVLIVDHYMDEMNGLEVCEALKNHPSKKILLTGGVNKEKIAIEAFNDGLIHRYINKSSSNFSEQLLQAVHELKETFFYDLSFSFSHLISYNKVSILRNPTYFHLVKNIQNQFNSIEYYLLDTNGSCIFIDTHGQPVWLIIKHESEISDYAKLASDHEAPLDIINKLINKENILFFFSEEDYQNKPDYWHRFAYPTSALPELNGYYYSIIEGHIRQNLEINNIAAYHSHRSA